MMSTREMYRLLSIIGLEDMNREYTAEEIMEAIIENIGKMKESIVALAKQDELLIKLIKDNSNEMFGNTKDISQVTKFVKANLSSIIRLEKEIKKINDNLLHHVHPRG